LKQEARSKVPDDVKEYEAAIVFDSDKYNTMEIEQITVTVIGQVELSEDEMAVLRLHPKFSIRDEVTADNLEYEQELGYAKVRYELRRENEEALHDEDTFGDTNANKPTFGGISSQNGSQENGDQNVGANAPKIVLSLVRKWRPGPDSSMMRKRMCTTTVRKEVQMLERMPGLPCPNQ
jgi:hypothetical protein